MNISKSIINVLFFFIMPVFWLGLIRVYLSYRIRIKGERRDFVSAINPKFQEGWIYLKSLIILGIVGSVLTYLVGAEATMNWILLYESIVAVALLIPGLIMPIIALFLAIIIPAVGSLSLVTSLLPAQIKSFLNTNTNQDFNFLAVFSIILLLTCLFMKMNAKQTETPKVKKNRRGNKVANYSFNRFTIFPLLLLIPGNAIQTIIPFWPVFNLFGTQVTFILVPFLIGFKMNFSNHLAKELLPKIGTAVGELGIIGIFLCIGGYYFRNQYFAIVALTFLMVIYLGIIYHFNKVDKKSGVQVEQSVGGIRVIGVKPNTPSAKMGLEPGDLITEINGKKVNSEDQLYEALQRDPTYCKMKIKNRAGQLEIKETAIFDGAPHEIGIEMFEKN